MCGGGRRSKTRTELDLNEANGSECTQSETYIEDCNTHPCPGIYPILEFLLHPLDIQFAFYDIILLFPQLIANGAIGIAGVVAHDHAEGEPVQDIDRRLSLKNMVEHVVDQRLQPKIAIQVHVRVCAILYFFIVLVVVVEVNALNFKKNTKL